jgi:hypothetical protein
MKKFPRAVEKMSESNSQQDNDAKNDTVVIKTVRIKRSKRVIRTPKIRSTESQPAITPTTPPSPPPAIREPQATPLTPSQPEINTDDTHLHVNTSLWEGASNTLQSPTGLLDRISQPGIQYNLFLLFLSIWGAAFILFYLSTSFAIILPDPFNLVVLGFFLVSTSLTGIYSFVLGIQHLQSTRQSTDDSYY